MNKLPNECFFEIFNNFQNKKDYKNLFSYLLVNRQWCRIIIPILWSRPIAYSHDKRLIRIYLLALNAKEQSFLIPFKIVLPNCPKSLFEYSSYTTFVNGILIDVIKSWLDDESYGADESFRSRLNTSDNFEYDEENEDLVVRAVENSLIAMFLRTSKNLKELSLWGTIINKAIFENLYTNTTIIYLSFVEIYFDSGEIDDLIEIIGKNSTMTSLNLSDNSLGFGEIKALSEAIHKNTTLTSLQIYEGRYDLEYLKVLLEGLYKNSTLTTLDIGNNYIEFEGVKLLAKALCTNTTLSVYNNQLGPGEGKLLAESLCVNTTLITLKICGNRLSSKGAKALAEALRKNTTLTNLDIAENSIGDGVKALAEALCVNTALTF